MALPLVHYWRQPAYRYRLLAAVSMALLLATAACSFIYLQQLEKAGQHSAQLYGESMAHLAAEQSANSTFDKDPISLQAIARKIARKPAIVSLIIYDNNNQILAQLNGQAGAIINKPGTVAFFTAPIVASDNVIGSITLGVAPSRLQGEPPLSILASVHGVLLVLTLLFFWLARKHTDTSVLTGVAANTTSNTTAITTTQTTELATEPATGAASESTAAPLPAQPEQTAIYLLLHIKNTHVLYQQLNAESRQQQFDILEQHIQQAAKLYNGKIASVSEDSVVLSFIGDDSDSIYNALYSGELILKLNQQKSRSMMVINGFIQRAHATSLGADMCDTQKGIEQKTHQLFIDNGLLSTYHLDSHLDTEALPGSQLVMIQQFKGSYATLLENQLAQLQSQ